MHPECLCVVSPGEHRLCWLLSPPGRYQLHGRPASASGAMEIRHQHARTTIPIKVDASCFFLSPYIIPLLLGQFRVSGRVAVEWVIARPPTDKAGRILSDLTTRWSARVSSSGFLKSDQNITLTIILSNKYSLHLIINYFTIQTLASITL